MQNALLTHLKRTFCKNCYRNHKFHLTNVKFCVIVKNDIYIFFNALVHILNVVADIFAIYLLFQCVSNPGYVTDTNIPVPSIRNRTYPT